jgi:hypothetical protein
MLWEEPARKYAQYGLPFFKHSARPASGDDELTSHDLISKEVPVAHSVSH